MQGSAASNDAASAAAVSFLLGGGALNEACDILIAQSSDVTESQIQSNKDHCQKLATLYRKGKAAYNIISRTSDASSSDRIPMMTPGNIAATSSAAGSSAQTSSAASISHTPSARSRGSFTTPHGSYSKMSSGVMHKKKLENGGGVGKRILNRSLSDTSEASNHSAHGGGGNGNRTAGKIAINSSSKKQQQRKSDPPPEVLNFLKALNAGGTTTQTSVPSSSTLAGAATNNSRKQPASTSMSKQNTRKRPSPPPPRSRQSSRSSTEDEDHEDPTAAAAESTTTTRTRSKRTRTTASSTNKSRLYDIGEFVFVQVDGKHYNAIIKNVDFKQFGDEAGDDNDAEVEQRPTYEVEFSDGEVWEDVDGDNVHSADEED